MAYWSNASGGKWSVTSNWLFSQPPGPNDIVTFVSGPLSAPSVIDAAYTNSVLGDINLQVGITLDVERSVSTTALNFAATDGSGTDGGLMEVGNGATLTLEGDLVNQGIYIGGDGVGAEGTFIVGGTLEGGGLLTLNGVNFDTTVGIDDSTGQFPTLELENGATYAAKAGEFFDAGTIALAGGSELNFGALAPGALNNTHGSFVGQEVTLSGSNNALVLPDTTDGAGLEVVGFNISDRIEVAGITGAQSANYANSTLKLYAGQNGTGAVLAALSNVSLEGGLPTTLDASHFTVGTDSLGSYVLFASCFAPGTHIRTAQGEVEVERLREGDLVMTVADSGLVPQPVRWIGRRRLDFTQHPYPRMVSPIRVMRGAFADDVPHADLVLSPDHCIAIDGRLVPSKMLVNGATIRREFPQSIEYFHVECESHAIILAEGLTVETYLDTGNRAMFENAGVALIVHPDFCVNHSAKSWDSACAPLTVDPAAVQPIWQRLRDRADQLGCVAPEPPFTTTAPDLALLLPNGRRLRPSVALHDRYVFVLPGEFTSVTLMSRSANPSEERPWLGDERQLGVAVRSILLKGEADFRVISADDPSLSRGWWDPERDCCNQWRWTDGGGLIPLPFPARLLEVEIAMTTLYPETGSARELSQAA